MSAGSIVVSGGVLAGVILLCIVVVLCYCRLQYYCCKKNDPEVDLSSAVPPDPLSHFPCDACDALAMDGRAVGPASLDRLDAASLRHPCPTCSPYPARHGLADDVLNGGERLGFHTYRESPSVPLAPPADRRGSAPLSWVFPPPPPPPPRPYSTQV